MQVRNDRENLTERLRRPCAVGETIKYWTQAIGMCPVWQEATVEAITHKPHGKCVKLRREPQGDVMIVVIEEVR